VDRAGNGEGVRHDFPIFAGEIPLPQDSTKFLIGRDSVEPSDKTQSALRSVGLPPEEGEDQTQHDANNDAGDDWEIECAVAAFDADIARQTSEPAAANAAPEQKAKNNDHSSENDEKFSELGHLLPSHKALGRARLCRA